MNVTNFFGIIFKIGLGLFVAGKLAQVTFDYAVSMGREQESGLISLGQLSRHLENSKTQRR